MANGIVWYFGPDLDSATENPVVLQGKDESGNILHEIRFGGVRYGDFPYCFVARPDGRLYVGLHNLNNTFKTPNDHFRVYHQEGYRIDFPNLHDEKIFSLHVDASDNIYVGGLNNQSDSYYIFRKYNSSGALQWSKASRTIANEVQKSVMAIAEDASGNLYIAVSGQYAELTKYNSSGTHQWTQVIRSESGLNGVRFLGIDSSGYIYAAGDYSQGYYQNEIYDTEDWTYNFTYYDAATYTGGPHEFYNVTKWDSSGNFVAGIKTGTNTYDFKIINDYLYILSYNTGDTTKIWAKYSTALVDQGFSGSSFTSPPYASFSWFDINPDDETIYTASYYRPLGVKFTDQTTMPALPLPLFLGEPYWQGDRYTIPPALALALSLGLPQTIRDYVGPIQLPSVYRLYLTGGTGTIELPLSSFSCRRGAGVMTISAIVPAITDTQMQQVIDRIAGNLIIKRGIRFSDGTEQLDEMLSAPLDTNGYRFDSGSASASATLLARDSAEVENPKTRIMRAISYRNSASGKRRVRCAVDTYLRPGDTADLGGDETMVVADITYSVSTTQAVMEISESD